MIVIEDVLALFYEERYQVSLGSWLLTTACLIIFYLSI